MLTLLFLSALELPMEVHGLSYMGKYFTDSKRYNIDATIDVYGDLVRFNRLTMSIEYRHDLDMASGQEEGVTFDPKYVHYYIIPGLDFEIAPFIVTGRLSHDCLHLVDVENPSAPVFNRLRFGLMSADHHWRHYLKEDPTFTWRAEYGFYPQWQFYKWMNWGTDYMRDFLLEVDQKAFSYRSIGVRWGLNLDFNQRMWGGFYHNHRVKLQGYYRSNVGVLNIFYEYYLYATDPLKSPNRLGILCLGLRF